MTSFIEHYQALSEITAQMREAAAQGEWDRLVTLEEESRRQVGVLMTLDLTAVDEAARLQKVALIKKILADDAEIRRCTQVWMQQLRRIMQSARSEQKLQQTYSPD